MQEGVEWKPRATPVNFLQMVTTKDPRPKLALELPSPKFVINPDPPKKPFASTMAKDSGTSSAQPHPRSQISNAEKSPKCWKPTVPVMGSRPARSFEIAVLPRKSVERKRGKVREQFDLFVVAQRAEPVLCYHKKVGENENLGLKIELSCLDHDTRMRRGEGKGGGKAGGGGEG